MPRAPARASRTVVVERVALTLRVDRARAKVGEAVTFSGEGPPDEPVELYIVVGARHHRVATTSTRPTGRFSVVWTVPASIAGQRLGCRRWSFYAYCPTWDARSNAVTLEVAFPTRLTVSAPSRVRQGEEFTVSGALQYHDGAAWRPIAGARVELLVDGRRVATLTTNSNGRWAARLRIREPGAHTIEARYAGT